MVQGHVDTTALCMAGKTGMGVGCSGLNSRNHFAALVIEKGSVAVNGISLTCFNVSKNGFSVAIIPYTFEYTNMKSIVVGKCGEC